MLSGAPLMRPAARSAAVRPHSSFPLPAGGCSLAPRPVSAASSCFASIFFVPSPRPVGRQSCLVAAHCSHGDWEHGRGWERFWEQRKRVFSAAYARVPTVPTCAPAHVMRLRSRACSLLFTSLGTWEHSRIVFAVQRLALFPSLFPAPARVGTWEQSRRLALLSDGPSALANKVDAGNGDLQRAAGGAREKFRGCVRSWARAIAADQLLELGRIQQLTTRRGGNGGKLPFVAARRSHVGTAMLESSAQAAENALQSAARRKLGRLRGRALGELAGGAIERPSTAAIGRDRPGEGPGTPNLAPSSPAMLALHARRNSIETGSGSIAAVQGGPFHDRDARKVGSSAQIGARRAGPGVEQLSIGRKIAGRRHDRGLGKRAGVNSFPAAFASAHEAGGNIEAARDFRGRQGPSA